jgi:exodeoxyribonuclease-3
MMKFVSWNVNGLRACMNKGFEDVLKDLAPDAMCVQETKLSSGQIDENIGGYNGYWSYAEKKGYSGTAVFTKLEPLNVTYGIGSAEHDSEGRAVTLEFEELYLVCIYSPNSQEELKRIDYRVRFEDALRQYLLELDKKKPVVFCGDLNVAHEPIDIKNPKSNEGHAGYSQQERSKFTELLDSGFTDSFRYLNPDLTGAYSWWSYRFNARANNAGWRIDYFCVSDRIKDRIKGAYIRSDIFGSDHCPVEIDIDI